MSDRDLYDAVARKTGEDSHEIARRGFVLTVPEDSGSNPEPECLLDVMLVDLPETGTVDPRRPRGICMTERLQQYENPCFSNSKSVAGNGVWVQVPPPALQKTGNRRGGACDARPSSGALVRKTVGKPPRKRSSHERGAPSPLLDHRKHTGDE